MMTAGRTTTVMRTTEDPETTTGLTMAVRMTTGRTTMVVTTTGPAIAMAVTTRTAPTRVAPMTIEVEMDPVTTGLRRTTSAVISPGPERIRICRCSSGRP